MKKGFTLIELLVVVLIIGILAAVALPQYQIAVEKARMAQVIPILQSIRQAEEEYYLANGEYTSDMNALAVSATAPDGWRISLTNQKIEIIRNGGYAYYGFVLYFTYGDIYPGQPYCWAAKDNEKANRVCKTVGPKATDIGENDSYNRYFL
ncbi:MAG: prepilin-type N-terminal cleavage/methylation domain-containing protein [Elusimicrobiaceae bacterium]|nr:prepilin-type N-terminal cleavage/methylation domain-containing protein [Elusimicrobiaceae bacterium]